MEGLMSEATDLILSSHRNTVIGPDKIMKWESGSVVETSEGSSSFNSFTLLRLSITKSIRDRHIDVEVPSEKTSKGMKNKRRKEPSIESPKVDIRLLNSELAPFHPEQKERSNERGSLEQNKSDIITKTFTELLDDNQLSDPEVTDSIQSQTETDNYKKNETLDNEEQKNRKKIAQNGIKLATRKFSDSIFENCSTYSLAYPEVLQERDNFIAPKQELASDDKRSESVPKDNDHVCAEGVKNFSVNDTCPDDQVSLSDSFFVNIIDEENVSQNSFFHKENTSVKKNNARIGNDSPVPESSSSGAQKRERKLSKKLRKRSKKSKLKGVPTYECPKCGVSYVLSNKTSESTARCLHCDFWTSVEPEFLKREKQLWNTCRIC